MKATSRSLNKTGFSSVERHHRDKTKVKKNHTTKRSKTTRLTRNVCHELMKMCLVFSGLTDDCSRNRIYLEHDYSKPVITVL